MCYHDFPPGDSVLLYSLCSNGQPVNTRSGICRAYPLQHPSLPHNPATPGSVIHPHRKSPNSEDSLVCMPLKLM